VTVLVLGADGQLGQALQDAAAHRDRYVIAYGRRQVDITDREAVTQVVRTTRPDCVINAAAMTDVDACEVERDRALAINGEAVGSLARLCAEVGTRLLHISTDYVFGADVVESVGEADDPGPVQHYGASKLLGERLVHEADGNSLIVRTSWLCSGGGRDFVSAITRRLLSSEASELDVVADQVGCLTAATDLAEAIMALADDSMTGVLHATNAGEWSRWSLAVAIAEHLRVDARRIRPISTSSLQPPRAAVRPSRVVLRSDRREVIHQTGAEALGSLVSVARSHVLGLDVDS
jgi:dTDP-4-dehydrorhamnose reductase